MSQQSITIPPSVKNRIGQTFGRLAVVEFTGVNSRRKALWLCQCECGQSAVVESSALATGNTRTCGKCIGTIADDWYRDEITSRIKDAVVVDSNECWIWCKGRDDYGYGKLFVEGKVVRAHVVSYRIHRGDVSQGQVVCHRCDNPPCCNPNHLFLGTQQDNVSDMVAKKRHSHGETHATSLLTEEQVGEIRSLYVPFKYTQEMLAQQFGVSRSAIGLILSGQNWKASESHPCPRLHRAGYGSAKLSEAQISQIRELYVAGNQSYATLAKRFQVGSSTIQRIVKE